MTDEAHEKLVIRDVPSVACFAAAVFMITGLCSTVISNDKIFKPGFPAAGAIIILFFGGISSFVADRRTTRIRVTNSLLLPIIHNLSFDDIVSVVVQKSTTASQHHTSTSYRLALHANNGKDYPLTLVYGGGHGECQKRANQIRRFIGLAHRQALISQVVWAGETAPPAQEGDDPWQ